MPSLLSSSEKNDDPLYGVAQIQKAMQEQNADVFDYKPKNYIPPGTPTEEKIAQIWSEVLGFEKISTNDGLFALGGDSIVALQILARIQQMFQLALSMEVIFTTSFTISELSQLVDDQVISLADENELAAILEEIDELSDDEVKALLNKSDNSPVGKNVENKSDSDHIAY